LRIWFFASVSAKDSRLARARRPLELLEAPRPHPTCSCRVSRRMVPVSLSPVTTSATPAVAGRETGPGRTRPEAGRAASVCGAVSRFRAPPYRLSTSLRARGGARLPQEGAWTAKWRALHGSFLALLAVRAAPSRIVTVRFTGPLPTQRRGPGSLVLRLSVGGAVHHLCCGAGTRRFCPTSRKCVIRLWRRTGSRISSGSEHSWCL